MKTKEVLDLIQIRNYVAIAINAMSLEKTAAHKLSKMLPSIDKKIASILQSEEFENYIK